MYGQQKKLSKAETTKNQRAHSTSQTREKKPIKSKTSFFGKKEMTTVRSQNLKVQPNKNVNNISVSDVNQSLINENI